MFRWLVTCIVTLLFLHVVTKYAAAAGDSRILENLHEILDVDEEGYLPAMFSTLQLALAVPLLLILHHDARRSSSPGNRAWLVLAGVFCFLAADECFAVHERLNRPVTALLGSHRVPVYAWVVPYGALVAAFAAYFLKFWWRLPRDTRRQMAVAFAVFVGGAIGMELLGSRIAVTHGHDSLAYAMEVLAEESLEMFGIALFIRSLLQLIQLRVVRLYLDFATRPAANQELLEDVRAGERRSQDRRAA